MSPRQSRPAKPLASAAALAALLLSSLALAGDAGPAQKLDKASQQISEALAGLQSVKLGQADRDKHLEKARALLNRARAELLQAQGQASAE